jgi:hypothetical protein
MRVVIVGVWDSERVGFEPLLDIENKELNGIHLPHDPPDPHECPFRDTY